MLVQEHVTNWASLQPPAGFQRCLWESKSLPRMPYIIIQSSIQKRNDGFLTTGLVNIALIKESGASGFDQTNTMISWLPSPASQLLSDELHPRFSHSRDWLPYASSLSLGCAVLGTPRMLLATALGTLSLAPSCPDHKATSHLSQETNSGWMGMGVSSPSYMQLPGAREVATLTICVLTWEQSHLPTGRWVKTRDKLSLIARSHFKEMWKHLSIDSISTFFHNTSGSMG